jgi:hypothetical protein
MSNQLLKIAFFLLNVAFGLAILDLIPHLRFASPVIMLTKQLKHTTHSPVACDLSQSVL